MQLKYMGKRKLTKSAILTFPSMLWIFLRDFFGAWSVHSSARFVPSNEIPALGDVLLQQCLRVNYILEWLGQESFQTYLR